MRLLVPHLLAATAIVWAPSSRAQEAPAGFKAAIVYNLSRFASWPSHRFVGADDPVVLCVEASDPFAADLKTVDGKPVGRRRLTIRHATWPFSASCHMAYVSPRRATPANLSALASQGVVTVGDSPRFADAGAVRLIVVGRQIRFEINNRVAKSAGVEFSSQLLHLAVRVQ